MKVDDISANSLINSYDSAKAKVDGSFAGELESAARRAQEAADDAKLKEACKGFEAMFLNMMYSKMRDTVPDDSLFGRSHGEKIIQSMLDTELTNRMADAGGVGLAAMIYEQVSAMNRSTK